MRDALLVWISDGHPSVLIPRDMVSVATEFVLDAQGCRGLVDRDELHVRVLSYFMDVLAEYELGPVAVGDIRKRTLSAVIFKFFYPGECPLYCRFPALTCCIARSSQSVLTGGC